ncbi:MAG: CoA pyrophosphatase [Planctomycetia bacterium]|nr:CoA pyrophosphatase [Planctomycetia bacterium]
MNPQLPAQLAARLQQPLPGWAAQARYQPELSFGRHLGPVPADAKPAAVLVLLYPHGDQWHIPMILRPAHMLDHASQVSLPGGVIEEGESTQQAALREFSEELGAPADDIRLVGQLSRLYLFASNHQITPWVGVTQVYPRWSPNRGEVDRVLEIPLAHFLDPVNTGSIARIQRGLKFSAPCFCWDSDRIWGATSMILSELVASLADLPL